MEKRWKIRIEKRDLHFTQAVGFYPKSSGPKCACIYLLTLMKPDRFALSQGIASVVRRRNLGSKEFVVLSCRGIWTHWINGLRPTV